MALRAVVVGAGLIGACVSARLAQRGAEVTLLDAGFPGEGTTGSSFAWVDASHPSLQPYVELNVDGLDAWRRLGAALGDPCWLALTGTLTWERETAAAAALERHIETLAQLGCDPRRLTRAQALALEPDLTPGEDLAEIVLFPAEGYVFTHPALADILALGRDAGLRVRPEARVAGFREHGDVVCGVALATGEELEADLVVTCAGRWTGELLGAVDVEIPMIAPEPAGSAAVGLLVTTTPVIARLRRVIHADPFKNEENEDEVNPFTEDEVESLLKAAEGWERSLLSVCFFTGMRRGEVLGLRWSGVFSDRVASWSDGV